MHLSLLCTLTLHAAGLLRRNNMPISLKSITSTPAAGTANSNELTQTGNNIGDFKYVADSDSLFFWNGTAWRKVTSTNEAPTLTDGGTGSYRFATDGTPLVLNLTATDPEGLPLSWTYEVTTGAIGNAATITNDGDGTFTLTPSTDVGDSTVFELTFTGTDGENTVTATNEFTLAFTIDPDEQIFTSSTSFTVPADVYSISGVAVGRGGGSAGINTTDNSALTHDYYNDNDDIFWSGGGGALAYTNNFLVQPGDVLSITIDGTGSKVARADGTVLIFAEAGLGTQADQRGGRSAQCVGDAAYSGGNGYKWPQSGSGGFNYSFAQAGGGGAGGYDINGGNAGTQYAYGTTGGLNSNGSGDARSSTVGGGGVGLFGGVQSTQNNTYGAGAFGGNSALAGDGLSNTYQGVNASSAAANAVGGSYGGGAGFAHSNQFGVYRQSPNGAPGAVRLIWGGHDPAGREFPNTNTALSSTL